MRATVNDLEVTFASTENDAIRKAYSISDVEKPFKKLPDKVTPRELRQLYRVIGDALNQDADMNASTRVMLLRIRKQLKQVQEGIETIENVSEQ